MINDIRNTDQTLPIVVTSVRYNDSSGKLVRQYLERPTQLSALASTNFVINSTDISGGIGANFIVFVGSSNRILTISRGNFNW